MNVRVFLLSLLGLLAGVQVGCQAQSRADTGRNKNPTIELDLDPDASRAVATIRIGDEVRFGLPSDRGASYLWQIVTNDPRFLRQSSNVVFKPGATEAANKSTVSFIAQRPGRTILRFGYVPANGGKETEMVDAYEIVVTITN